MYRRKVYLFFYLLLIQSIVPISSPRRLLSPQVTAHVIGKSPVFFIVPFYDSLSLSFYVTTMTAFQIEFKFVLISFASSNCFLLFFLFLSFILPISFLCVFLRSQMIGNQSLMSKRVMKIMMLWSRCN